LGLDELSGKRRICAIGRYRIVADFDVGHHQLFGMNMHNRAILIVGGVVVAAVIAGAVTLLFYEKQDYRDCVALMWDRKHPVEVRQRQIDADFRECEAYRLREGVNCDCKARNGEPGYCSTPDRFLALGAPPDCIPDQVNPCHHLSLEELRRADADASRDKPPR
jgi:hypothetical protein